MPLAGMHFGGRQVELLLVVRHLRRCHFPPTRGDLLRFRVLTRDVECVQVHPAVALGQEPRALVVGEKLHRGSEPGFADPRLVVQRVNHARLAGVGIEGDKPAILVVGGARACDGQFSIVGHRRHTPANLALGPGSGRGGVRRRVHSRFLRRHPFRLGDRWREAAVGPHALAGFEVQHREETPVLRVADIGAGRNVLDVAGVGDVAWNDRILGAGGTLADDDEHMCVVG